MTFGDLISIDSNKKIKKNQNWYIGKRINPQFDKPYYVAFGQLSKTEAKRKEKSVYGSMYLSEYNNLEEYENKIIELKLTGFRVNQR